MENDHYPYFGSAIERSILDARSVGSNSTCSAFVLFFFFFFFFHFGWGEWIGGWVVVLIVSG